MALIQGTLGCDLLKMEIQEALDLMLEEIPKATNYRNKDHDVKVILKVTLSKTHVLVASNSSSLLTFYTI